MISIGQKFGKLTVVSFANRSDKWLCQCSCGNSIIVLGTALRTGLAKSCKGLEILPNYRIHNLAKRNKPRPELCERCRENPVAGLYYKEVKLSERHNINFNDYEWLCKRCQAFKFVKGRVITTEDDIYEIRKLYARGVYTQKVLAVIFKMKIGTINRIIHYKGIYSR